MKKEHSIFTHLVLFSVGISSLILGIATMVWHLNKQYMADSSGYLAHINDINALYHYEQQNAELLAELAVCVTEEKVSEFDYNMSIINHLIEIIETESQSPEVKLRLRLLPYLEKSLENHKKDIVAWQNQTLLNTSYYRYVEAVDLHNRIMGYIQEILGLTVDHSRQDLEQTETVLSRRGHYFILLILFIIGGNVLFYSGYTLYLSRPIYRLVHKVGEIGQGNLTVKLSKMGGPKEIQTLSRGIEEMTYKLKQSNEQKQEQVQLEMRLKEEELEKLKVLQLLKEAQLQGIQMQINPHFLFNTLNVISKMALLEEAEGAYELIIALSKFMRHSLQGVKQMVVLKEEVDMITQYLYILKARMGDQLQTALQIDSEALNLELPLFTLQPLVENAFKHGLEDQEEGGSIIVQVKRRGSQTLLRVVDNGKGLERKALEALRKKTVTQEVDFSKQKHIGVENVCYRLKHQLGERVSYTIYSKKGKGTIFTILINEVC